MKTVTGRAALAGLLILLLGLLAACGREAPSAPAGGGPMVPVLAFSELTVGPNRLPLGVLQDGTPVNDHGKYLCAWKKDTSGAWKVAVDTWNSDVNMMAGSAPTDSAATDTTKTR